MAIRISDSLTLPAELLTSTVGILGIRGSGKTNTAGVIVEEATRIGIPSSVADPTGAWWGIKSSADGKSEGLPFYVFGGEHADVPLEPETGEVMARFAVERRVPMVMDLSLMTKGRQLHFMGRYAESLYHSNREAFLQVIDETARFCPQTIRGGDVDASRCLGAVEDLGALGRVKGLGLVIVGQRAAKINKDVLTQCHTLIVHQTNSPQDKKAVDDWIGEQYGKGPERDQFLTELPRLKRGEAFIWSPTFEIFERVQIRARSTFDSSKTPEIGKRVVGPTVFASVDLEALSAELQSAKQHAIENDPKALKQQITDLKRQLAERSAAETQTVEVPLFTDADRAQLHNNINAAGGLWERIRDEAIQVIASTADVTKRIDAFDERGVRKTHTADERRLAIHLGGTPKVTVTPRATAAVTGLGKAEHAILAALAQHPSGCEKAQLGILSGYSPSSGHFKNVLGLLRSKGCITHGEPVRITPDGLQALGSFEPLPIGRELQQHWLARLGKADGAVLAALFAAYPELRTREQLGEESGYSSQSGHFKNVLGKLRTLKLVEGYGSEIRASSAFFEGR